MNRHGWVWVSTCCGVRQVQPQSVAARPGENAPNLIVILDLPGLLADHLRTASDSPVRKALTTGQIIRRGQGHSVRLAAPLALTAPSWNGGLLPNVPPAAS
ncbi:hypothetical protein [Sinosporangium siamense]|uniref:Uncharacterized protein n=1 Tax=Sinosporangium siamense TaxID=1367973 RepID=A0A919V9L7_9ACTN|nr:hypothetical protein [Sinosporangium siamense]GII94442.1 hypothetical protein Ssi02_46730 [Sinosporangium siamense]